MERRPAYLLNWINTNSEKFPLLTKEEEVSLAKKMEQGCELSRKRLIEHNLRFVTFVARKYIGPDIDFNDLFQNGVIGLIIAIDKFDYRKGRLSTYAYREIQAKIELLFDNPHNVVSIPLQVARAVRKLQKYKIEKSQNQSIAVSDQELIKDPKAIEIASKVHKSVDELLYLNNDQTISLDMDSDDAYYTPIANKLIDTTYEDPSISIERKQLVEHMLDNAGLKEREKKVIKLYYGLDNDIPKTFKEIAPLIGVGEQRIQQLHRDIIKKLQNQFENFELV